MPVVTSTDTSPIKHVSHQVKIFYIALRCSGVLLLQVTFSLVLSLVVFYHSLSFLLEQDSVLHIRFSSQSQSFISLTTTRRITDLLKHVYQDKPLHEVCSCSSLAVIWNSGAAGWNQYGRNSSVSVILHLHNRWDVHQCGW